MTNANDQRNTQVRREGAVGGNTRRIAGKPFIDPNAQIKNRDKLEAACADLCRGKPNRYPIFGLGLKVEMIPGSPEDFPAVVFYGTVPGHDLEDLIEKGFWVSVGSLFRRAECTSWKNPSEELLTMQLWTQPEMRLALATVQEERRLEQLAQNQERVNRREKVLAQLRTQEIPVPLIGTSVKAVVAPELSGKTEVNTGAKLGGRNKPARLERLADILHVTQGTIQHDGLTITVGKGPDEEIVVRLKNIPSNHEMGAFIGHAFFAKQSCLFYSGDSEGAPKWEGNAHMAYLLRTYLRKQLMTVIELTPPVSGDTAAPAENAVASTSKDCEKSSVVVAIDAKRSGPARALQTAAG